MAAYPLLHLAKTGALHESLGGLSERLVVKSSGGCLVP
jgi:hypothetical protein